MAGKVTIKGGAALARKLRALEPKVARKAVRTATRSAAKLVLAAARAAVPVDTGLLRRTLTVRSMKRSRSRSGHVVTTPERDKLGKKGEGKGYYPAVVEYGSEHQPAQPYLRPSLAAKQDEALAVMVSEVKKGIAAATGGT